MKLSITIFGESGGEYSGVTVCGLPQGLKISTEALRYEVSRHRLYLEHVFAEAQVSEPACRVASGICEGATTGAPITVIYKNCAAREGELLRPSVGDFGALCKYGEFKNRLSVLDRLTGEVLAGALFKQALLDEGILVGSHIFSLAGVRDSEAELLRPTLEEISLVDERDLPVFKDECVEKMSEKLREISESADTAGGVVELFAFGLPAGLGSDDLPFMSVIAERLMALPYAAGVEFGRGFGLAVQTGRRACDALRVTGGKISSSGGGFGGVDGAFSSGAPLCLRLAVAPCTVTKAAVRAVDLSGPTETELCGENFRVSVFEVISAAEGALATAIYDLLF